MACIGPESRTKTESNMIIALEFKHQKQEEDVNLLKTIAKYFGII